ncbi:oxidoreductase [Rhodobacteraceae bacterium (ex Bugula neritina AB1)]|nr:oxidoreductase [Rhodobacteraceae bacterium (ex Bugula neritina AB1)]
MTVIVTDTGFAADDWTAGFEGSDVLVLASDTNLNDVALDGVDLVRIEFPSFADGRGFTLARQLRLKGFEGRLRAFGHVIADQYAMARRSGFDEVELSDELAARQPEDQWLARANWQDHSYQARLRGSTAAR